MTKYCCICGAENTKENPIESHHIRAIRKSGIKLSGFSEIIKIIGKKQIIICSKCYHNIHNGKYDKMSLSDFYDPEFAKI
jgi:hypothetical protein